MFYISRSIIVTRMIKKFFATFTRNSSFINSCYKTVNTLDFPRIHGPTAEEVMKDLDLSGSTCLITGANSGIGLEMTRCLTSRNCTVLAACRNIYAASNVTKDVCDNYNLLRFYETNLASLKSVKKCADEIMKDLNNKKIDIVILNAGIFGLPWTLTDDLLETTFQVNYLSQFYLLMNIDSILAPNVRVVFVSSESHRNINWSLNDKLVPTEDLVSLSEDRYTSIKAYNISKLCGILAMHYLSYRWINTGKSVLCAHPGSFVKTRLCRNWWPYEALYTFMIPFSKSIKQAASTPLYCATRPELAGLSALYYKDCRRVEESELARDLHLAFRMHDLSRDLIRERASLLPAGDARVIPQPPAPAHDQLLPGYSP